MGSCSPSAIGSEDHRNSTALLWDRQECVPLSKVISDNDIITLLTPVVVPLEQSHHESRDPFESLGKSISKRHPLVRHVPYTRSHGITGVHVAFIKRAKAVIFVMTDPPEADGAMQLEYAEIVGEVCDARPLVLVACCPFDEKNMENLGFPTVIKSPSFTRTELDTITSLLIDEAAPEPASALAVANPVIEEITWRIDPWDHERDSVASYAIWMSSMSKQFHMDLGTWQSLLRRDGYAMHHGVWDPRTRQMVGFCLTYTTFAYSSEDLLIGSIAALVVREDYQGRGIGRLMHEEALSKLNKIRGTRQIQLGSTFPRLLYGLPAQSPAASWFKRRGWGVDDSGWDNNRVVGDWVLRFSDLPTLNLASAGLSFRRCDFVDYQKVIEMVDRESVRKKCFGWYDQYARVLDSAHMEDVLLGFEGETLVATAITYTPKGGSSVAADLPWAGTMGDDMGGVTCICIKGK
jgi:GNAT superfamily N-acetyltransferase